ncbi:MAG: PQQ-binding-like beta-propeller repeat protein [Phycisphaerae bacterium]
MDGARPRGLAILAVAAAVLCALPGEASAQPKWVDPYSAEDYWPPGTAIEWKATWDDTYKTNVDRWAKQLPYTPDGANGRRLRMRQARLLEEMLKRFSGDAVHRISGQVEMADCLIDAGLLVKGCGILRKLIDEAPGDTDRAVSLLAKIIGRYRYINPDDIDGAFDVLDYAATRVIALYKAGVLSEHHGVVLTALRRHFLLRRSRFRNLEAWEDLRDIEAITGRDVWWRVQYANFHHDLGRIAQATELYQEVAPYATDQSNESNTAIARAANPPTTAGPPTFPRKASVEGLCSQLASRPLKDQVDLVRMILRDAADGLAVMPPADGRTTATWTWADRMLQAQAPDVLAPLRAEQQKGALPAAKALASKDSPATVADKLALWRRFPWAAAAQEALLEAGETMLRQGQASIAKRTFQDVLAHCEDATIRNRAQAGVWLVLLQQSASAEEVNNAFRGVSPDGQYHWLGSMQPAKAIQAQLLAAQSAAAPPLAGPSAVASSSIARRVIQMPPASPSVSPTATPPPNSLLTVPPAPAEFVQAGNDMILAGPDMLCCYGPYAAAPRWTAAPRVDAAEIGGFASVGEAHPLLDLPGPYRPAVAGGMVFARWGHSADGRVFDSLAAFDQAAGRMIWSSSGQPDKSPWHDIRPTNDPAFAEGRLYFLATGRAVSASAQFYLACADARTGVLLWKKLLFTADPSIFVESTYSLDASSRTSPVTVKDGAVYCATGAGVLVKCDARDGLIEWAVTYGRPYLYEWNEAAVLRWRATAPLVMHDKVIFFPRDMAGVIALNKETGKRVWDNPFVPSEDAMEVDAPPAAPVTPTTAQAGRNKLILVKDSQCLAAIDASSGTAVWSRRFDEPLLPSPMYLRDKGAASPSGPSILVASRTAVYQVAAHTGVLVDQSPMGTPTQAMNVALHNGRLECLTAQSAAAGASPAVSLNVQAAEPGAFSLPVRQTWQLDRPSAHMILPPPEANLPGKLLVVWPDMLECVTMSARGAVDWRLMMEQGFNLAWADKMVLAVYPHRVVAINAASGAVLWETPLPVTPNAVLVCGPYLTVSSMHGHVNRHTCVIELATGKVLWNLKFSIELGLGYIWQGFTQMAWDGTNLHFFGRSLLANKPAEVICRTTDGKILDVRGFPPDLEIDAIVADKGWGLLLDSKRRLFRLDFGQQLAVTPYAVDLKPWDRFGLRISGNWCAIPCTKQYDHPTIIIRKDDPNWQMVLPAPGRLEGDKFFALAGQPNVGLTITDLPTGSKTAFSVPPAKDELGQSEEIVHSWEYGGKVYTVTGFNRNVYHYGIYPPSHLRLDVFDKAGGKPQASQVLTDVAYWKLHARPYMSGMEVLRQTRAAFANNVLFVMDDRGLHALASLASSPGAKPDEPAKSSLRSEGTMAVDGSADDWREKDCLPLMDTAGRPVGRISLSYDKDNLYIGLAYPAAESPAAGPRIGRGGFGGGPSMELALSIGQWVFRYCLGLDAHGRAVMENTGGENWPDGFQCIMRQDPLHGQVVCELAFPLRAAQAWNGTAYVIPKMFLCAAGWDGNTSFGAAPMFIFKKELTGVGEMPKK